MNTVLNVNTNSKGFEERMCSEKKRKIQYTSSGLLTIKHQPGVVVQHFEPSQVVPAVRPTLVLGHLLIHQLTNTKLSIQFFQLLSLNNIQKAGLMLRLQGNNRRSYIN